MRRVEGNGLGWYKQFLTDFDIWKKWNIWRIEKKENFDLEYTVLRMDLTYDNLKDVFDRKVTGALIFGYPLPVGMYEISDVNLMSESSSKNEVNINITIEEMRLK